MGLLGLLTCIVLLFSVRSDYYFHGNLPFSQDFQWPQTTPHTELGERLAAMIPPGASVSAESMLVPHISQREHIYQFPYAKDDVDYIFVDVTGDIYPYYDTIDYVHDIKSVLLNGHYGIVAAQDGYLLLKRGLPVTGVAQTSAVQPTVDLSNAALVAPQLPENFCSYMNVSSQTPVNPFQVTFTEPQAPGSVKNAGSIDLVGYSVRGTSGTFSQGSGYMAISTYWKVASPINTPLQPVFFLQGSDGTQYFASDDVPNIYWCQTNTWQPGMVVKVTTRLFGLQRLPAPKGLAHLSMALLPLMQASRTIMDVQPRLPVRVINAPSSVSVIPGVKAVQLMSMTITP
jgi:hypothetical protein